MMPSPRFLLEEPQVFLQWLADRRAAGWASFDDVDVAQIYAIAASAALGRHDGRDRLLLPPASTSGAARFAHAVGIDEVLEGECQREPTEQARTVTLTRVRRLGETEAVAKQIVDLTLPRQTHRDAADLYWFVLVELLRNVVQHSRDPAGGIVAAQVNDAGPYAGAPALQVVVVDNGIGVHEALRHTQPNLTNPAEALVRAMEPHVSGTFAEGQSGTVANAGLGLFFIAEMAKQTRGRLLLATRGATYFLDRTGSSESQPRLTNGDAPDYPGTLVVFETALSRVGSYDTIIRGIHELAGLRTPKRITHHWLRFEAPATATVQILVDVAAEDTVAAHQFVEQQLIPRLIRRESVTLDFRNLRVCTQSFLHALLHEAVRLAWARKVPLFVVHAVPTVRAQLEFVEAYSLGG
ncbi:MAG: sensor histidine kinase [Planctomycetes bacterium]|nr:sensor histidine kinase [Planctomycetota bacterium]